MTGSKGGRTQSVAQIRSGGGFTDALVAEGVRFTFSGSFAKLAFSGVYGEVRE